MPAKTFITSMKSENQKTFIDDNFTTMKFPHQYAELMDMTPKYLNRISKNMLGITVIQLITQRTST